MTNEEVRIKDTEKIDDIVRKYTIIDLPPNHFLGLDKIRIYDNSIYYIRTAGDKAFSSTKWELLREGTVPTMEQARAIYAESGDWTEEHEKRFEEIRQRADKLNEKRDYIIAKRDSAPDKDKKKFQKQLDDFDKNPGNIKVFTEWMDMLVLYSSLFMDTIEWQARERRQIVWLVYSICKDEGDDEYSEDKRVWKSLEEFEKIMTQEDIKFLLQKAQEFWEVRKGTGEIPFFGDTPGG